jgi:hypothetical protein
MTRFSGIQAEGKIKEADWYLKWSVPG